MINYIFNEGFSKVALTILLSFSITYFLIPIIKNIGFKYDILDIPNARKQHKKPIVSLGGVAITFSCIITLFILSKINPQTIDFLTDKKYYTLFICLILSFLLGLIDDIFTISPWPRLSIQFVLASFLWSAGISIDTLNFDWINDSNLNFYLPKIISFILTSIWLVGFTNSLNWIDGLDGLAGGITIISLIGHIIIASILNNNNLLYLSLILFGSILAFLRFNKKPASILMGDGGSYFLGYSLGSISIINYSDKITYPFFVAILLFSVPLLDMVYVILNRVRGGKSPFKADRAHIHHRLINRGYSQMETTLLLLSLSQFSVIIGISFFTRDFKFIIIFLSGMVSITYFLFLKWKINCSKIK